MAKRCDACGTVSMDTEAHSCAKERAARLAPGWTEGSFLTGLALGFFLGLLGILIAYFTKQHATYQGSLYGLLSRFVIAFLAIGIAVVFAPP